jgi:hypothetical protein
MQFQGLEIHAAAGGKVERDLRARFHIHCHSQCQKRNGRPAVRDAKKGQPMNFKIG